MAGNREDEQISQAVTLVKEMRQLIVSVCEDIRDSKSMANVQGKIDRFCHDMESIRDKQRHADPGSYPALDGVGGHTRYLQGISLPIMVNSVIDDRGLKPSDVSEMHIADVDGVATLIITPTIVG